MTADPTHTTTKTSANCGPPSLLLSTTLCPCNILHIKINPVSMHLYISHSPLKTFGCLEKTIDATDLVNINHVIIHSKYFPNSDWLKAHA